MSKPIKFNVEVNEPMVLFVLRNLLDAMKTNDQLAISDAIMKAQSVVSDINIETRENVPFVEYVDLRQKYIGVLQLLAMAGAYIPESSEDGRDLAECIDEAFEDCKNVLPGVKIKKHGNFRILNFIDKK